MSARKKANGGNRAKNRSNGEQASTRLAEYPPGQAFSGVIGRTFDVSQPAWPAPIRAKEGAPNVLFIVLDDTGFGHLGCYGSPIRTPNIDALAADGLRYNNRSEEHTSELQSLRHLVCRLLLEKKKN